MPASLYNDEFVINDLIRAAHPGGGTNVIGLNSPSGGDGRVEDIIEQQVANMSRILYHKPVVEKLASLMESLDSLSMNKLCFDVAKLTKYAAGELDPGNSLLGPGSSPADRYNKRIRAEELSEDQRYDLVWRKSLTIASRALRRLEIIHRVMESQATMIRQRDRDKVGKYVRNVREELADIQRKTLSKEYDIGEIEDKSEELTELFSELSGTIKDTRVDNSRNETYPWNSNSWGNIGSGQLKKLDQDILTLSRVSGAFKQGNLNTAEDIVSDIPDPGVKLSKIPPAKTKEEKDDNDFMDEQDPELGGGQPQILPSGGNVGAPPLEDVSPERVRPQREPIPDAAVIALQKILKLEPSGIYDAKMHQTLYTKLLELAAGNDKPGEVARFLMENVFDRYDAGSTASKAEYIYLALLGKIDPSKVSEVAKVNRGTSHMNFTSPLGRNVINFPIGAAVKKSFDNPFYFIKALQGWGALPVGIAPDVLLESPVYDNLVSIIRDKLLEMGDETEGVAFVEQAMRGFKEKAQSMRGSAAKRRTTMEWLTIHFPHESGKIRTSTEAMKEVIALLSYKNISIDDGYINARKADANKYYIRDVLEKAIRMHGLDMATGPAKEDPAGPKASGDVDASESMNVGNVLKIINELVDSMLKSNNPRDAFSSVVRGEFEKAKRSGYMGNVGNFGNQVVNEYNKQKASQVDVSKIPSAQPIVSHPPTENMIKQLVDSGSPQSPSDIEIAFQKAQGLGFTGDLAAFKNRYNAVNVLKKLQDIPVPGPIQGI